jgi:hypothetical protein
MKTTLVVILGIVALVICLVLGSGCYALNTYNDLVRQENGIKATYEDMQNVHASVFNQIKSQGLVVEKYGDMVIQALDVAMSGRYGAGGSQAAMQWIQEQNPTIDPQTLAKLQTVIEAGYTKFEAVQRTKIDKIRIYQNTLQTFPNSLLANVFGFPRIDMAKYGRTISTSETKTTFETGEMKTIDPFAK